MTVRGVGSVLPVPLPLPDPAAAGGGDTAFERRIKCSCAGIDELEDSDLRGTDADRRSTQQEAKFTTLTEKIESVSGQRGVKNFRVGEMFPPC